MIKSRSTLTGAELEREAKDTPNKHSLRLHNTYICHVCCRSPTLGFVLMSPSLTFLPPLWQDITNELGITTENLNYGYATAYGSLTIACLIFIPLSINFGRRPVYLLTSLIMIASAAWMGCLRTTADVIGSNFLSGIAGAVNEALFNMTICDPFFVHQRGTMTGTYLIVVILGTYLAPVAAGYIAASQGWRWVFWYCIIFMSATFLVMLFALEETKFESTMIFGQQGCTDISREAHNGEKTENGDGLQQAPSMVPSILDSGVNHSIPKRPYKQRHAFMTCSTSTYSGSNITHWVRQTTQPFLILALFPAVMFSALQYAWSESMLSFLAVTQATLYPLPPYNFSAIGIGNMNIPPAIGAIIGSIFGGPLSDWFILWIARRRGGVFEPEYRLYTFLIPGMAMVAGVLMYGLTISEVSIQWLDNVEFILMSCFQGKPWIINAIGAGFVGFALGGCGDIALTYVQDSYDGVSRSSDISIQAQANVVHPDHRASIDRCRIREKRHGYRNDIRDSNLGQQHGLLQYVRSTRWPSCDCSVDLRTVDGMGTALESQISGYVRRDANGKLL